MVFKNLPAPLALSSNDHKYLVSGGLPNMLNDRPHGWWSNLTDARRIVELMAAPGRIQRGLLHDRHFQGLNFREQINPQIWKDLGTSKNEGEKKARSAS
jgi:hypothetical protein